MEKEYFDKLWQVMKRLRKECPWDKEQTHDSIKAATLEEAYEAVEAIDEKDYEALKGELGDLLLHIVFHSAIAEEADEFTLVEVIDGITEKLIRRHPHIFGDVKVKDSKEIEKNWEAIKLKEKGRKSVLDGIPKSLSALLRAYRIQEKVSKVGFDWEKKSDVWEKVEEELHEFKEAEKSGDIEKTEEELGDLLFALVNYSRFLKINPENALRKANEKFTKRFAYVEKRLREEGIDITNTNLQTMDKFWEESKNAEN
jgi:XTP/dITP diphosphohydrolase